MRCFLRPSAYFKFCRFAATARYSALASRHIVRCICAINLIAHRSFTRRKFSHHQPPIKFHRARNLAREIPPPKTKLKYFAIKWAKFFTKDLVCRLFRLPMRRRPSDHSLRRSRRAGSSLPRVRSRLSRTASLSRAAWRRRAGRFCKTSPRS